MCTGIEIYFYKAVGSNIWKQSKVFFFKQKKVISVSAHRGVIQAQWMLVSFSVLRVTHLPLAFIFQCLPTGCQGGATSEVPESSWHHRVFLCTCELPECLQPRFSTLFCCRVEALQPACHPAIYSGRQQDVQWLLEPSPLPIEELQHLLPGTQQSKWSK